MSNVYTVACVAKCTFFVDTGIGGADVRRRFVSRWGTGDRTVEFKLRDEDEDEEEDEEDVEVGEDPGVNLELPVGALCVEVW